MWNFALPPDVTVKERVHDDGAARVGQQLTAQSDQPSAGDPELDPHAPVAVVVHIHDFALARTQLLHDHADEFFGNVNREALDWLHQLAIHSFGYDLGLSDHQFVAFAAHHLDQNGKLQLAAAHHDECVGITGVFDSECDVGK